MRYDTIVLFVLIWGYLMKLCKKGHKVLEKGGCRKCRNLNAKAYRRREREKFLARKGLESSGYSVDVHYKIHSFDKKELDKMVDDLKLRRRALSEN